MRSLLAAVAAVCLAATALWSQEFRGTITGRVTDAQEAVVPGVKIQVTEMNTGARFDTVSGADGLYTVPFLAPGQYRIVAEHTGFKRYLREGVQVSTNDRVGLDVRLELGNVVDSVIVTDEAPMLQAETASTGQVINSRQIENMPLNGRTPLVLAQLAYGVIPPQDPKFNRPFDNSGPAGFSMGGAPAQSNELLIDGAADTTKDNRVAYNPPVDAVAEVKVESFQADAAYGHTGGGTVNVVLKSGTNNVHGSAYEFNQVSNLTASNFFNNRSGQGKASSRYNQYGATIGAPVMIPRVLDGRNKVFFYFAYEGIKNALSRPMFTTVPTPAERNGDFSALLNIGNNYQMYDPLTGVKEGTRVRRQPFANNVIPANRINSIAKAFLDKFYPAPNVAGRVDGQDNFYAGGNGESNGFNNQLGRLDFNLSDKNKLFLNARHNNRDGSGQSRLGGPLSGVASEGGSIRTNCGAMLDDVYTFTPTLMLNTRANWTRFDTFTNNYSKGFDMTTLGFPASLKAASPAAVLPSIRFDKFYGVGVVAGGDNPFDIFQIFTTLTKIANKHSFKMGADLRQNRDSQTSFGNSSGSYSFNSNWARGPLDNSSSAPLGQDLAAFLLGLPTGGSFDVNSARTNRAGYYAFFLQDDFRPTPSLTLNLGIRYEVETATTERYNRTVNGFDMTAQSPIAAAAMAAYARNPIPEIPASQFRVPGGLLFASPARSTLYSTSMHAFSPRFGFAWTPPSMHGKTVVRGGGGVFFFPYGITGYNQTGFNQSTPVVPTLDGYLTPAVTLNNPFPNGIIQPAGASAGLATYLGRGVSFFNPNPAAPYSVRWNLDVQREIMKSLVLQVGYMGNHTVHLTLDRDLNYTPPQYLSTSPVRDQAAIDRLTANVPNPFAGLIPDTSLNGSTVARSQLLKAFPQFSGVTEQSMNHGSSYFHLLQVRLEKRFSHGLQLLANYSYSKLLERASLLNAFDAVPEQRVADEDRPQRFIVSASYELPFGRGKAIAGNAGRVWNQVIGGWVVNSIYTRQLGQALSWGNIIYYGGPLKLDARNIDHAFDTTQFNTNSKQQLDQNIRTFPSRFGNLRNDGVNNFDFSAIKNFTLREPLKLQYRAEFFNALNHPTFSSPNTSVTSSNFGYITGQANLPRTIQMALRLIW